MRIPFASRLNIYDPADLLRGSRGQSPIAWRELNSRNAIGGLTLLSAISATRERQKQLIVVVTHCRPLMLKLEYRKRLFFYRDA